MEMNTTHTSRWIAHTSNGQAVAKCAVCGSNSHPANVGTDEDCARCTMDAQPKMEPLELPKIDVTRWIRITR